MAGDDGAPPLLPGAAPRVGGGLADHAYTAGPPLEAGAAPPRGAAAVPIDDRADLQLTLDALAAQARSRAFCCCCCALLLFCLVWFSLVWFDAEPDQGESPPAATGSLSHAG